MNRPLMLLGTIIFSILAATSVSAGTGFCPVISVVDSSTGVPGATFPNSVNGLVILVDVGPEVTGVHSTAIELVSPSQRRFRVLNCAIGASLPDPTCTVTPLTKAHRSGDQKATWTAMFHLPVKGTSIQRNGLWGEWQIRPTLDGVEAACPGTYGFTLEAPVISDLFADDFESGSFAAWSSTGP